MVRDYKIIEAHGVIEFERAVKNHIKNGWKLQGGVCITEGGLRAQALIRVKHTGIK